MSEYYSCEQIQVLRGVDAVRKRPGMYIGDTRTPDGLHRMVREVIDCVLEEHVAGYASELRVELGPDSWITIHDDGVGIPTDEMTNQTDDVTNALEAIFTRLHGGARRSYAHVPMYSGGVHGVGVAMVNALCEELVVETTYQGVRWSQSFARGERAKRLGRFGSTRLVGTTIRFRPDPTIFASTMVDQQRLRRRLHEIAFLYPHLRVWFQEQRMGARGGIVEWARWMASERGDVVANASATYAVANTQVKLACAWNVHGRPVLRAFVNNHPVRCGSHDHGLWAGFCAYAREVNSPARGNAHVREAIGCGLVAVLHVMTPDPRFTSQTRDVLQSDEVRDAVRDAVLASLRRSAWGQQRFLDERLLVDRTRR